MATGIAFYDSDFFVIKSDADLIKESIKRIIMTNIGERVNNPFFGMDLKNFVFELDDEITRKQIIANIKQQIQSNEPRVNVFSIDVSSEDNYIKFFIKFILVYDKEKTINEMNLAFKTEE